MIKNNLLGVATSDGIAVSNAYVLHEQTFTVKDEFSKNVKSELKKYLDSKSESIKQLEQIRTIALKKVGKSKAEIFSAHIAVVEDVTINQEIIDLINHNKTALYSVDTVYNKYYDVFVKQTDPYFRERAVDLLCIKKRILSNLSNIKLPDLSLINKNVIVVAKELAPSQIILVDKKFIKGIIVEVEGKTGHTAILAKTLEIPTILGVKNALKLIKQDDIIAMNGCNGKIEINPKDLKPWTNEINEYETRKKDLLKYKNIKTVTLDKRLIDLEANISNYIDVDQANKYGCDGIGLYRSEFIYMNSSDWPDEESQFVNYKKVLEKMGDKLVIVRTMDIGGDKQLPYYTFDYEQNPFLGFRAIRFSLKNIKIFETQLRALIRASIYGNLGIMFPMIATVDEIIQVKEVLAKVFSDLKKEKKAFSKNIQIGIMIEIPSAALNAKNLAKHVDFFSIGTNDLIQYTMACDRTSKSVSYLYEPNNPAILSLIKIAIDAMHNNDNNNNKWIGMCGEMSSEILSIPLLIGMGLKSFSMSATSILRTKKLISNLKYSECKQLVDQAFMLSSCKEINDLVKEFLRKRNLL